MKNPKIFALGAITTICFSLTGCDFNSNKEEKPKKNKYNYLGQEMTLAELSELSGLSTGVIYQRIESLGWTVEKAVETPKISPSKT